MYLRVFFSAVLALSFMAPVKVLAAKPRVLTTVAPITSVVENVAGDRVEITAIVPEGVNSHTFEPVPSDAKLMTEADLIILNGLDLEIPALKMARANKRATTPILLLGDRTISEKEYIYDFSFPKDHGHPNPHLWPDPVHAMQYARLVRDALIQLDPGGRAVYEANTKKFLAQLQDLDDAIGRAVRTVPENNRRLLTYHDSWPYFARRYGFEVIGAVQPSDFADPSPREVARLIDQLQQEKVPAVFGSEVFPSPVLEQIAREGKTAYIDKLRDDDLPGLPGEARHSYVGMMLENMETMLTALGGSTEALRKVDPAPVAGSHAQYR
jgi:ABC-type Zn uptake system ZnuABC Zn-binding protein ZnuA